MNARLVLFLLSCIASLQAQSAVSIGRAPCAGSSKPSVLVTIPISLSGITVTVPICAELGSGIVLNTAGAVPRLEVAIARQPRAVSKTFPLAGTPETVSTKTLVLDSDPAPGSMLLVAFRSSRLGADSVQFIPFQDSPEPRVIVVDLPPYRPLLAEDVLTVAYWSLE